MSDDLPESAARFRSELLSWAEENVREYPWRDSDRSFYEVFIAEFFLTQTPADNVANVYPDFLERFSNLQQIRNEEQSALEEVIEPLGFQRMRADALSRIATEYRHLPDDPEELEELPRVGPYVTNATLCFALERPVPILDRNVNRVYRRVFGERYPADESQQVEFASKILPNNGKRARTFNLALLDFGALVCTKRTPNCEQCFASDYCTYFQTGRVD